MTNDTRHPSERVYDEEMAPLVAQLIEIAKRSGIPLLVSAGMVLPDGDGFCSTNIPSPDFPGATNRFGLCLGIIRGDRRFDTAAGLMITRFHSEPGAAVIAGARVES